jgi:hypothetical protein
MAYHANKPKTDRPKLPTEKAAAAALKKNDNDDDNNDKPEQGAVRYSRKEPYHAHLKQLLGNGSFDPATVQLRDFLKVHKDYKQLNRNSLRSAFNDARNEYLMPLMVVKVCVG